MNANSWVIVDLRWITNLAPGAARPPIGIPFLFLVFVVYSYYEETLMKLEELEQELFRNLTQIVTRSKELECHPLLIGGYAVRAYARMRKRVTEDLDLVISRHDQGNFIAALKALGYEYRPETAFGGIKATKPMAGRSLELHISVDKVWDISSDKTYPLPADIFTSGQLRPVEPYSERSETTVQAPVIPLEDLLILKLMTLRELDTVDTIALLLENPEQVNITSYRRKVVTAELTQHINVRIEAISQLLKSGQANEVWKKYIGIELSHKEIETALTALKKLIIPTEFICPTSNSPQKHTFKTDAPRIDNLGNLYAFCPVHTYTCYELVVPL
jgi:hypothetical protein